MTSLLAKYIAKRFLGETAKNHFGTQDPYFERVPASEANAPQSKKVKKRPKAIPEGVSEHDGKVLVKARRRAYRLDQGLFNFCGIKFGYSSVVGFIPAFGDALDLFMALMVIKTCGAIDGGLPPSLKRKMYINAIIDLLIGLVPFAGDLADAVFKCNTRNVVLLEKYLEKEAAERKAGVRRGPLPASVSPLADGIYSDGCDNVHSPPPYEAVDSGLGTNPARPEPARIPVRRERGLGWFSLGGGRPPPPDLERGQAPLRSERAT